MRHGQREEDYLGGRGEEIRMSKREGEYSSVHDVHGYRWHCETYHSPQ